MGKPDKDDWYHAVPGDYSPESFNKAVILIKAETLRSFDLHGCPLWGRHEAYAIIKEEVDEMWEEVKKDGDSQELALEVIQVAAMCLRYLCTDKKMQKAIEDNRSHRKIDRLWRAWTGSR